MAELESELSKKITQSVIQAAVAATASTKAEEEEEVEDGGMLRSAVMDDETEDEMVLGPKDIAEGTSSVNKNRPVRKLKSKKDRPSSPEPNWSLKGKKFDVDTRPLTSSTCILPSEMQRADWPVGAGLLPSGGATMSPSMHPASNLLVASMMHIGTPGVLPRAAVSRSRGVPMPSAPESADELGNASEPLPEILQGQAGYRIWGDVFRRADKNDDGAVSFQEFSSYFGDGSLSQEDKLAIFRYIDTEHTNNISRQELCAYFSKGFQQYRNLYTTIERLQTDVQQLLFGTSRTYHAQNYVEKFKTRFYLREASSQLKSLLKVVEGAVKHLQNAAMPLGSAQGRISQSAKVHPAPPKAKAPAPTHDPAITTQTIEELFGPTLESLQSKVDRLGDVVQGLMECKIEVIVPHEVEENPDAYDSDAAVLVISRQLSVIPQQTQIFREELRDYVMCTRSENGIQAVSTKFKKDTNTFFIYEIWTSEDASKEHYFQPHTREFQRKNIDLLSGPATSNQMWMPASWGW
eukprot:CAMPEP_0119125986 /NCGR_PEP_ID=MMETSP1310-20130426/5072_1 /TAXON_ID=464262 /ORGANISM="Genus nov. species nov., Strain RCC2339" /LENGTH=519 /DNA_ID=CAMNT_0007116109 /DNA_START=97 /DNA_END=1653 /DNA_ORIENTATION=+